MHDFLRTDAMKSGYMAEMDVLQDKIQSAKSHLEEFYAERHDDKDIKDAVLERYDGLITGGDQAILAFTSGIKIVKAVLVSVQHSGFPFWKLILAQLLYTYKNM